jgi:HEAT repeat protein
MPSLHKSILAITVFLSIFVLSQPGNAQDKAKWAQAKQDFQANNNSKKHGERLRAVQGLADALYPEAESEAVDLLVKIIADEINLANNKFEDRIDANIIDACVQGLRKITTEKAVEKLIKHAKNAGLNWRARFNIIKGLGGIPSPKKVTALVELIEDKSPKIKLAVFDALGSLGAREGAESACKLLNSEEIWEVKIAVTEYLNKLNDQSLIEPLIQALMGKNLEGRPRDEVASVLKKLTGVDCGLQGSAWMSWWNKKKQGTEANPSNPDEDASYTAVYYGVKVTSTRIVFILDISGSMDWGAEWTEDEESKKKQLKPRFTGKDGKPADDKLAEELKNKKEEIDKRTISKRIEAAKRELINTIYNIDSSVYFTIIFFHSGVIPWKESLIPATAANKLEAIQEIDKQLPNGNTATFDALETAYKLNEQGSGKNKTVTIDKSGYVSAGSGGADTIFLVSDGVPTAGKITDRPTIVSELKKINETRKIKINTVGVGSSKGVPPQVQAKDGLPDINFLRSLAEVTGGIFVDKTTP